MIKFDIKYYIGDEVYTLVEEIKDLYTECDGCNAQGEIILMDGKNYLCPKCNGLKEIKEGRKVFWEVGNKVKIKKIEIWISEKDGEEIFYGKGSSGRLYRSYELFKTIEEAQEECNIRNK